MHTPRDPFAQATTRSSASTTARLAFADGRILATGASAEVGRRVSRMRRSSDARDALLLPGLVDTHVHWPQLGVVGRDGAASCSTGCGTARCRRRRASPTRPRGRRPRSDFVQGLAANGTTTALVFGSHFPPAQEALLRGGRAQRPADRERPGRLRPGPASRPARRPPTPPTTPASTLAQRWHGRGRLRYAVTPRFSISCSEAMLESCGALARRAGRRARDEPRERERRTRSRAVARLVPLGGRLPGDLRAPRARRRPHGARPRRARHRRRAGAARRARGASVAHCPSSNAFLGSGIFPMTPAPRAGVRFALGTDVGAGTGLSVLKEGADGLPGADARARRRRGSAPAQLLWLATRAGALALGLGEEVGDLTPRPRRRLRADASRRRAGRWRRRSHAPSRPSHALGTLFTLAREESVAEVRVAGSPVYTRPR